MPFKLKLQVLASCPVAMGIVTIVTIGSTDVKGEVSIQQLWDENAFLPQVSHEELEANQGKDTETKDGQDHGISQLLHWLDESADDGLQT